MLTKDDLNWDEKLWVSFRHVNGTPTPSYWRAGKRQSQPPGGGVPAQLTWYANEEVWGGYYNGKSFKFEPHRFGHREKTGWMTILAERQGGDDQNTSKSIPAS